MKLDYIIKEESNTRLILIAAGWSAGPETARGVGPQGWDVAVMHDFTDLSLDTSFLDGYYTVYLFAWSLGVFAASRLLPPERITAAVALNGTLNPVSDTEGIPPAIFEGTAEGLNERNLLKFRIRMAGSREGAAVFGAAGKEDIENLRGQLLNILEATRKGDPARELPWIKAFISDGDLIFPPENMKRAWRRLPDVETVALKGPHYIEMSRIVGTVIADTRKVSEKFGAATRSYDTHAIAQYSAAIKLAARLAAKLTRPVGSSLEFGCGTGLFTREYARVISPRLAAFVDITPTGPFGIAPEEEYAVEDAERWIERDRRRWDVILSASAIQWFADIPRFLHLCARRLAPGGVLAVSTFLPGNMGELDELRPAPLRYPDSARLREWMERDFVEVEVTEDEIAVEFRSLREMLLHLKHTGVAGSAPSAGLSIKDMAHLRRLTYRPVYVLGVRK